MVQTSTICVNLSRRVCGVLKTAMGKGTLLAVGLKVTALGLSIDVCPVGHGALSALWTVFYLLGFLQLIPNLGCPALDGTVGAPSLSNTGDKDEPRGLPKSTEGIAGREILQCNTMLMGRAGDGNAIISRWTQQSLLCTTGVLSSNQGFDRRASTQGACNPSNSTYLEHARPPSASSRARSAD